DNIGDAPAVGSEVVLRDKLPENVKAQGVSFYPYKIGGGKFNQGARFCKAVASEVTCKFPAQEASAEPLFALNPYESLEIRILVKIENGVSGLENEASISGGEASPVSVKRPLNIGNSSTQFGVEDY